MSDDVQDVWASFCSCKTCTSTIRGGRMSRWQDANERRCSGRMGKFLLLQNVHFHHPWWSYVAVASYRDI